MKQQDIFGQPAGGYVSSNIPAIKIQDNQILEKACNRLLSMVRADSSLLDGDTMGEIDRRLFAEIAWEDRFAKLVAPERKGIFIKAMMGLGEPEVYTRARRELLRRDIIRVSAKAIRSGEQFRSRIAGAMRG